ncbi:folate-binding protein YgfZ [Caulobacter segnis]|uniref:CAF17-like 4Fe-4S cluster assembly/insertion protein YgfZ n=1 Tax=Caulobacter segnis TaxID=88688 RepID=UPI00240F1521|nr:folate-binding protein YgfZ [Caulobacter segnis]MDG2520020.1 folate-binding protein YgfZ [Caulobacter segnis]
MSIARLSSRALIRFSGLDWRTFLQGQLTQDVSTLQPGEARFAALLTPQGRLMFDLFVVGFEDGAWLDIAAEHRDAMVQRMTLYRLRAKVDIAADDAPVLAAFDVDPVPGEGWVRDPRRPDLGWRGYGVASETDATEADYDAFRLAQGVPGPADWAGEKTYPIEANFDLLAGIDFKKGCFVGQETTSRMKRRGQIKNRMLPITFDGPPPAYGAEVLAGTLRAGEVLSGVDGRAMALLRLDRIGGADLTVDGRSVRVERPDWIA